MRTYAKLAARNINTAIIATHHFSSRFNVKFS
jgi:hypothetical protein